MARRYDAYLARHWAFDQDCGSRLASVYIQSGVRALGTSLAQAMRWMQERAANDRVGDRAPPTDGTEDDRPRFPLAGGVLLGYSRPVWRL